MHIYDYRPDHYTTEVILTEATARKQLMANPVDADVNYFAAPWSVMLNASRKKDPKVRGMQLDGGFTICQHVHFHRIIPECIRIGLDTLFTPHAEPSAPAVDAGWAKRLAGVPFFKKWSREKLQAIQQFKILPFPHLAVNGASPAENKDLWWSFAGFNTHATREVIFDLPPRDDVVNIRRETWHFNVSEQEQEANRQEYRELLSRSRFSLCPRGVGPSTVRFWESLEAGAIPVLIADDMRLPCGFDWDRCVVRIPECETARLNEIVGSISTAVEQQMRSACYEAYRSFSGENFASCVHTHYKNAATSGDFLVSKRAA